VTRRLPYVVWLATGAVWGTTWIVIRVGLVDLPPFLFAGVRTALAGIVLLLVAQLADGHRRPPAGEAGFWLLVGVPQLGVPYALIFWAERSINAGLTALLFATFPVFTALLAHYLLRGERLTPGRLGGTALAVSAVALLVGPVGSSSPPAGPVAAVLLASLSGALGAVLVRRHGRTTSTVWLTALQVTAGAVVLLALALAFERNLPVRMSLRAGASILYLALVVTVGCYLGLFWLLKHLSATFVSMGVVFETAVAVTLGALLLGEPVGSRMAVGLVLVALSIVLVNRSPSVG